jgi:ribonuclease HI
MRKLSRFIAALAGGDDLEGARGKSGYGDFAAVERDLSGLIGRVRALKEGEATGSARPDHIVVCCDGASRGNPGPSAAAAIAYLPTGEVLTSRSERIGETTNNVAEYRALILGLQLALDLQFDRVIMKIDSQLVANQMNGEYRIKSERLSELAGRARELSEEFASCEFRHIRREENSAADRLAADMLRKKRRGSG